MANIDVSASNSVALASTVAYPNIYFSRAASNSFTLAQTLVGPYVLPVSSSIFFTASAAHNWKVQSVLSNILFQVVIEGETPLANSASHTITFAQTVRVSPIDIAVSHSVSFGQLLSRNGTYNLSANHPIAFSAFAGTVYELQGSNNVAFVQALYRIYDLISSVAFGQVVAVISGRPADSSILFDSLASLVTVKVLAVDNAILFRVYFAGYNKNNRYFDAYAPIITQQQVDDSEETLLGFGQTVTVQKISTISVSNAVTFAQEVAYVVV